MPISCLRIYVDVMHVILCMCMLRRLRTRHFDQSDRYDPPGQSGRLSVRQADSVKTHLKHIRVTRRSTLYAHFGTTVDFCRLSPFDLGESRRGWTVGWASKSPSDCLWLYTLQYINTIGVTIPFGDGIIMCFPTT